MKNLYVTLHYLTNGGVSLWNAQYYLIGRLMGVLEERHNELNLRMWQSNGRSDLTREDLRVLKKIVDRRVAEKGRKTRY